MFKVAQAETADHYFEFNAGYARGELTTAKVTNLYQLQLVYGEVHDAYDVSATLPYLYLKDDTGNYSGVGDIVLRAGMILDRNATSASGQGLYGSVAVKLPTAAESENLGSGKIDLGGFLSYTFGLEDINLTIMGGYIVTGDSPGLQYADILVYGIGVSRLVSPWYLYSSLEGRQKTLTSESDSLDLNAGLFYQLKPDQFIKVQGYIGLKNEIPEHGLSIGVVNWF